MTAGDTRLFQAPEQSDRTSETVPQDRRDAGNAVKGRLPFALLIFLSC